MITIQNNNWIYFHLSLSSQIVELHISHLRVHVGNNQHSSENVKLNKNFRWSWRINQYNGSCSGLCLELRIQCCVWEIWYSVWLVLRGLAGWNVCSSLKASAGSIRAQCRANHKHWRVRAFKPTLKFLILNLWLDCYLEHMASKKVAPFWSRMMEGRLV